MSKKCAQVRFEGMVTKLASSDDGGKIEVTIETDGAPIVFSVNEDDADLVGEFRINDVVDVQITTLPRPK
jgi:hypothetical protein